MAERSGRGGIAVMQWSATVVQRSGGRRGGSGDTVVRHNGAAVRRGPLRYLMTDRHRISTPATPRCQKSTSGHRARWYARRGNLFLAAVGRDGAAKKMLVWSRSARRTRARNRNAYLRRSGDARWPIVSRSRECGRARPHKWPPINKSLARRALRRSAFSSSRSKVAFTFRSQP